MQMTRFVKILTGFVLIIAGLAMLVLPGPGILTILAGLTLIAQEYIWARRLSDWVRSHFERWIGSRVETPTRSDQAGG